MMHNVNPFPNDPDRRAIWEMLVHRDIVAFVREDWSLVQEDFIAEGFMGIDAHKKTNPDFWTIKYPTLEVYKLEWLRQARLFNQSIHTPEAESALYKATQLRDIEINGSAALVHKKFDGLVNRDDGKNDYLNWQTLYRCRKVNGIWKITGFTGYMPYSLELPATNQIIRPQSGQHKTAGPYSPVLEIITNKLVVISGQAAIDKDGNVVGDSIEEQTRVTMENCRNQLQAAGVTLNDVFKVNVYMTDLALWPRFNEVYKTYFDDPLPARAAVGVNLLMTLLVEIEMWAVKK